MDEKLKTIIDESKSIVFFGGTKISTESNIPDFRSEKGLYHAQQEYGRSPEEMLSHTFFMQHMKTFYDYYKKNLIYPDAQPNKAHLALNDGEIFGAEGAGCMRLNVATARSVIADALEKLRLAL